MGKQPYLALLFVLVALSTGVASAQFFDPDDIQEGLFLEIPTISLPSPPSVTAPANSSGDGGPSGGGSWDFGSAPGIGPQTDIAIASESLDSSSVAGEASRIFAGPNEFPPANFGAYAIVAFKSIAGAHDRDRHKMICEAYRLAIPPASQIELPLSQQLVTVWPIATSETSAAIGALSQAEICSAAVENYGHVTALRAIRDARRTSIDLLNDLANKRGPFLFAWNPSSKKGESDAIILRLDLSNVSTPRQAKSRFEFWVQQIETHPELWLDGWQHISIENIIAETADEYGTIILDFLGIS